MGKGKLLKLLEGQYSRNPLPSLAFRHFYPQRNGISPLRAMSSQAYEYKTFNTNFLDWKNPQPVGDFRGSGPRGAIDVAGICSSLREVSEERRS